MKQDPDLDIVQQAQRGDRYSYELLYLKYHKKISRLLTSVLSNQSDVDDALQEVFIKAYRALPDFKGHSQFYTWLYRIALNTAYNHNQRQQRRAELQLDDDLLAVADQNLQLAHTPEAVIRQKEILSTLQLAVSKLPRDQRRTLILREIEGLSYQEIARVMECSIGTVRSRLHRARDAIAKQLEPTLVD